MILRRALGLRGSADPVVISSLSTARLTALQNTWIPCYHAKAIVTFASEGTKDIFLGKCTQAALRACPKVLWRTAARGLINSAAALSDLAALPGNRLEPLHGD